MAISRTTAFKVFKFIFNYVSLSKYDLNLNMTALLKPFMSNLFHISITHCGGVQRQNHTMSLSDKLTAILQAFGHKAKQSGK